MSFVFSTILIILLSSVGFLHADQKPSMPFHLHMKDKEKVAVTPSDNELYQQGIDAFQKHDYQQVVEVLQSLEMNDPFSQYIPDAYLLLMYAAIKAHQPELAESVANRFIHLNPNHPSVDYAYLMRALSIYYESENNHTLLDLITSTPKGHSIESNQKVLANLNFLISTFPKSRYQVTARKIYQQVKEELAYSYLRIADFYFQRKAYVAAICRAQDIAQAFSDTPAGLDALAMMVSGYQVIGLKQLADETKQTLYKNKTARLHYFHSNHQFSGYEHFDPKSIQWQDLPVLPSSCL